MAVFEYKAIDVDTSDVAGTIIADSPRQARDVLRDRGLMVTDVELLEQVKAKSTRGRGGQVEVISFIRELATLLGVGIPLLSALQTLSDHRGRKFKAAIQRLTDQVPAGVSLADAMSQLPRWFDDLCVNIVRVGENTGHLEMSLKRLAEFKQKAHRLRSSVTTALMYPAIVCIVGTAIATFLMTYVVPNLLTTLTMSGKPLPFITQIVKGASDFLIGWWWGILLVLVGVVAAVQAILQSDRGRLLFDKAILRMPLLGELIRKENTSRMAIVLAALLRSGLHFVEAVSITRVTIKNRVFRIALANYGQAVSDGKDIAGPLKACGVFSSMVIQMLSVGQQSGQLEEMLEQLSEAYDQEVAIATQRFTAVLEPLLIVLIAIGVGLIAFATILPILEVSNVL